MCFLQKKKCITLAAEVREMCLPESDQKVLNEVSLERMKNESACLPVERRVFGEVSAPFQANYTMRHNI